jgi:hypothetical protein
MAKIFMAVPLYRKMPKYEIERIKKELNLEEWETQFDGFHPMFDVSTRNLCISGHDVHFCCISGDGNLPRVRSFAMGVWKKEWEEGKKWDYYLIVDEDISFSVEDVNLLIEDDKPIIGGIYTFKTRKEPKVGMPVTMLYPDKLGSLDGPFEVKWLNGGFILVKAEVLHHMIREYPDLKFDVHESTGIGITETWGLWIQSIHKENGSSIFLSEDYAFCQRAREIGYSIWADWRVKLVHWDQENGYGITPTFDENIELQEPIRKETQLYG